MADGPQPARRSPTAHKQTARDAEEFLIQLAEGYRRPSKEEKRRICAEFGIRLSAFDIVRDRAEGVDLIEVKGTRCTSAKAHFFSVSDTEIKAAEIVTARGGSYRYLFVIVYGIGGVPRTRMLTLAELLAKRTSYTVQYSMRISE